MSPVAEITPEQRVQQLLEMYDHERACAAELLCDRYPADRRAFRFIGPDLSQQDYSYGALRDASERFANVLGSLGVKPGDRVATLMGKSWPYLVTVLGIWRLGAVHVPLFTAFAPPAIALRLNGSRASVVVCDATQQSKLAPGEDIPENPPWQVITTAEDSPGALGFAALMADSAPGFPAAAMGGDAPLIQIYTSGTTGNPKGVVVPLRALAAFRAYMEFGFDLREDDVYWCAADPGWAYGLYYAVLGTLLTGVPSLLLEGGFDAAATYAVLSRQGVTNFAAAPTVYRALRASGLPIPQDLALRCASSAGEPLTPEVNEWAESALGVTVHDHYGQTEAGMLVNNHHHPAVARPIKAGSMGQAMPGWVAAVLKDDSDEIAGVGEMGRIAFDMHASPLVWFKGYEGDPEKSAERFSLDRHWYLTGDTGMQDEDGYLHFSSRDDDVIIMAGYRIGPFEVESVIVRHPAVVETAVIAVPDPVKGEVMETFVVLKEGENGSPALAEDIKQWVKTRYAAHAFPREVHFVNALPKTPSGKIQRFALKRQRLEEVAASQSRKT